MWSLSDENVSLRVHLRLNIDFVLYINEMNPQSHQQHIYMSAISSLIKEIMTLLLRE